jgi:diacylglycerol kinase (ATP)
MRVTLLHHPGAGEEGHQGEELQAVVAAAGHEVLYRSLRQEGWEASLDDPGDLVVVAGGDGSVSTVFRKVATREVPVTLLPLGSANNVARTLGLADVPVEQLVRGWADGRGRRFDIAVAKAPWGETHFVESIGGGIFGEVLEVADEIDAEEAEGDEKVTVGLELMRAAMSAALALPWSVEVDGVDLSGDYIAVEVTNIREIGPNFPLAADADPGDGLLDVVLVGAEHREALAGYFEDRLAGVEPRPQRLSSRRGKRVSLRPPAETSLHVDDEFWPDDPEARQSGDALVVTVVSAVTLLLPAL